MSTATFGTVFQSTHRVRGATIHSSLFRGCSIFQSTHPVRGATIHSSLFRGCSVFQSTHPVRGATLQPGEQKPLDQISIHAPRAGCDHRATSLCLTPGNFNPRTPCGVRRQRPDAQGHAREISIHAPRAGCDHVGALRLRLRDISIHAPRAGCDSIWPACTGRRINFNPRTPCGVRRMRLIDADELKKFQSTHPVRGATSAIQNSADIEAISIHAPRAGCDNKAYEAFKQFVFQSTHPVRGATQAGHGPRRFLIFQSTHPVRGATGLQHQH